MDIIQQIANEKRALSVIAEVYGADDAERIFNLHIQRRRRESIKVSGMALSIVAEANRVFESEQEENARRARAEGGTAPSA